MRVRTTITTAALLTLCALARAHDGAAHAPPDPSGDDPLADFAGAAAVPSSDAAPARHVVTNQGRWSVPESWPVLAVHAALLPTGEVLAWDATPDDFDDDPHTAESFTTRVTLWDPETNAHTPMYNEEGGDLFCAGSSQLWDGRIVFAGGDSGPSTRNGPLSNSNLFDPWQREWRTLDQLEAPRWYSSVAPLASGKLLTYGGTYSPRPIAEVFELNHKWSGLDFDLPLSISGDYAWLQTTSFGDVAYLGPDAATGVLGTERGAGWARLGNRGAANEYRSYGSYALYDVDKVLISGGGDSLASSVLFDLASGETGAGAPMLHGRRQHNLTILADGSVLASGGNSSGVEFVDQSARVAPTEIWLPETNTWHETADLPSDRQYHSVALLLADGRVLTAGGGYCGDCEAAGYFEDTAEVFSPPYLFEADGSPATRPTITGTPAHIDYNRSFDVTVDTAEAIDRVHLIKLGSTTHSQNQGQRLVPLEIRAQEEGALELISPATRNIAPPGHYMLIAVDANGVPSESRIVLIGQPLAHSGEVIKGRTRTAHVDVFEIDVPDASRLAVTLQQDVAENVLRVRRDHFPAAGTDTGFDACEREGNESVCTLEVEDGGTFLVAIESAVAADWAAVPTIVPMSDPAASESGTPAAPAAVTLAKISRNGFELSWDGVDGALGYQVYRNGELLYFVRDTMLFDEQLESDSDFVYAVRAVGANARRSAAVASDGSRTDVFGTLDVYDEYNREVPSPPLSVRLYIHGPNQVALIWDRSQAEEPVTRYEVYRNDQLLAAGDFTGHTDPTVVPGVRYRYHVVAVGITGTRSTASTSVSVDTATAERPRGFADRAGGPVTVGAPLPNDPDAMDPDGTPVDPNGEPGEPGEPDEPDELGDPTSPVADTSSGSSSGGGFGAPLWTLFALGAGLLVRVRYRR